MISLNEPHTNRFPVNKLEAENKELRRQREALRAVITGMILAVKGRSFPTTTAHEFRLATTNPDSFRAKYLDEAVEMGFNILDQTEKV